jgi:transcription elongation factor Elf1
MDYVEFDHLEFTCPKCNTENTKHFTMTTLKENKPIVLACKNCDYSTEKSVQEILNIVQSEVVKEFKKQF